MVKGLLLSVLLLLSMSLQALTQLSAQVDKNPALRGESVTLTVKANAKVAADAINFRALEQDFTVMLPSVSTSSQIINGQASQSTSWTVVLLPKTAGSFTIPAFTLQGLSSEPITLQVLDETPQSSSNKGELFLQASIEQQQLYVQQLSYYQVTIYFNGDLQRGSLSEPQLADASISQVGDDIEGTELVNGMRYRTISRRYAITPQRSGNFSITPPTFSGEMIDRDSARYNYFARTKTVVQQAQPIDITVKPLPDTFPGNWLIAGLVTLTEEWSPELSELKQGEPVTRTITLSAVDVAENQLPELQQDFPEGLRLYQEQPQSKSAQRNGRLVAQKIFTTAVIANKAGSIELPEVVLPWWNSQTNQLDYARLPKRTLKVIASAQAKAAQSTTMQAQQPTAALNTTTPANGQAAVSHWQWNYLSWLLLALWLLSLFAVYLYWQLNTVHPEINPTPSRVRFNSAVLKQACQQGDAQRAKAELLRFAHQQFDQRYTALSQLSQHFASEALNTEILALNRALYANSPQPWQGDAFWHAWQQYHKQQTTTATTPLSPLYPS
ncbi:BatD family protein [Rheinheimera pleomorphica]|uniref:BatD family protein n=1 Tax=Rheinheimera pleomorphica TaxID=2703963 RepID=UPI0014204622|nr:BatD family protein [Rheinheimera pleomorphica]